MLKMKSVKDSYISFVSLVNVEVSDIVFYYSDDNVHFTTMLEGEKLFVPKDKSIYLSCDDFTGYKFVISGNVSIVGDLMDLYKERKHTFNCRELFLGCDVTDASLLKMPTEFKKERCFRAMFMDSKLMFPPKLPAIGLTSYCYSEMFKGCELHEVPQLPAEELAPYCYQYMFAECRLSEQPKLESVSLAEGCYSHMFQGAHFTLCDSVLPAKRLKPYCYEAMYWGSNIMNVPVLPAKHMAVGCYQGMFAHCYKIDSVGEMFAEAYSKQCFKMMFAGSNVREMYDFRSNRFADECCLGMYAFCSNITKVYNLVAGVAGVRCFDSMFKYSSLVHYPSIKVFEAKEECFQYMFMACNVLNRSMVFSIDKLDFSSFYGMFKGVPTNKVGDGFLRFIEQYNSADGEDNFSIYKI